MKQCNPLSNKRAPPPSIRQETIQLWLFMVQVQEQRQGKQTKKKKLQATWHVSKSISKHTSLIKCQHRITTVGQTRMVERSSTIHNWLEQVSASPGTIFDWVTHTKIKDLWRWKRDWLVYGGREEKSVSLRNIHAFFFLSLCYGLEKWLPRYKLAGADDARKHWRSLQLMACRRLQKSTRDVCVKCITSQI